MTGAATDRCPPGPLLGPWGQGAAPGTAEVCEANRTQRGRQRRWGSGAERAGAPRPLHGASPAPPRRSAPHPSSCVSSRCAPPVGGRCAVAAPAGSRRSAPLPRPAHCATASGSPGEPPLAACNGLPLCHHRFLDFKRRAWVHTRTRATGFGVPAGTGPAGPQRGQASSADGDLWSSQGRPGPPAFRRRTTR